MEPEVVIVERRTFRYGIFTHAIAFELAILWCLVWAYGQDPRPYWFYVGVPLFPLMIWDWWGTPHSFSIENGEVTARTFWGRSRSWKVDELAISGAVRSRWSLVRHGYVPVFEKGGKKVFSVSTHLDGFEDFVEILDPGAREARGPEFNPKSWWNRDLLDR